MIVIENLEIEYCNYKNVFSESYTALIASHMRIHSLLVWDRFKFMTYTNKPSDASHSNLSITHYQQEWQHWPVESTTLTIQGDWKLTLPSIAQTINPWITFYLHIGTPYLSPLRNQNPSVPLRLIPRKTFLHLTQPSNALHGTAALAYLPHWGVRYFHFWQ